MRGQKVVESFAFNINEEVDNAINPYEWRMLSEKEKRMEKDLLLVEDAVIDDLLDPLRGSTAIAEYFYKEKP